jgi:hypothetical protein
MVTLKICFEGYVTLLLRGDDCARNVVGAMQIFLGLQDLRDFIANAMPMDICG